MAVYYKFKSAKDYDSVSIDGHFISVGNLKERIVERKNLGRGCDFDLLISNAQTNEEYTDDAQSIPKNTSVLVRRVPARRQKPIVAEVRDEKVKEESPRGPPSPVKLGNEMLSLPQPKQLDESEWADEFGVDLYAMPEQPQFQPQIPTQQHQQQQQYQQQNQQQYQHQNQHVVIDKSEEDKIKAFVDASASDWQRQTQESMSAGRGYGRGMQGRGLGGRGFGRGIGIEKKNPPPGYICHRCGVSGHFIQHCPTNGDPAYDMKKMRPPTGIPKSMLVANPDGSYALPSGAVAILRPNEAVFQKEIEGLPSNRSMAEIPPELRCPLCTGVLKDAVLTSRCCFKSYCDKCIRDHILSHGRCVCGVTNVLADDLLPNKTLRDAIRRLLETTTATSSAEHGGSMHQPQDMESAQRPKPKAPSPSGSASQKNISITLRSMPLADAKEVATASVVMPSQQTPQSLSGPAGASQKRHEPLEHTAESISRQELGSQGEVLGSQSMVQVDEEVQQQPFNDAAKKKRLKIKKQKPLNGEKDGLRRVNGGYESSMEGGLMPYPGNPGMYGGYWGGPQYMLDGFGQPISSGPFPFFGYGVPGPVPCEMPYGAGMLMPEPVGHHPSFIAPMASFQRDGMDHGMGLHGSTVMSREEFEARKAELRRKREIERRVQHREEAKDSVIADPSSSKLKKGPQAVSSAISSPVDDYSEHVEKNTFHVQSKTVARDSSSPQGVKRMRHERREETSTTDSRVVLESHKSLDSVEKSDKKAKPSVFSRISFPEKLKERSKKTSTMEKHLDSKDGESDGMATNSSNGLLLKRRVAGPGLGLLGEKHGAGVDLMDTNVARLSTQDSVKARKLNYKEDRSRRVASKSNVQDEVEASDEDSIYEPNFKHRASYPTSPPPEVHMRIVKRRQS